MGSTFLSTALMTGLLAMVPVLELRAAIPAGVASGLTPLAAYGIAAVGNLIPVPAVVLLVRRIFAWFGKKHIFGGMFEKLEARAREKGRMVQKYRLLGLILLVAIPLPGTGAWTGAMVAAFLDISLRRAFPAIALGVVIAGAITTGVTCGAIHFFW